MAGKLIIEILMAQCPCKKVEDAAIDSVFHTDFCDYRWVVLGNKSSELMQKDYEKEVNRYEHAENMENYGLAVCGSRSLIRRALTVFRRRFLFRKAYKIIIGGKTEWINI